MGRRIRTCGEVLCDLWHGLIDDGSFVSLTEILSCGEHCNKLVEGV